MLGNNMTRCTFYEDHCRGNVGMGVGGEWGGDGERNVSDPGEK